jgi:hypothetical protein
LDAGTAWRTGVAKLEAEANDAHHKANDQTPKGSLEKQKKKE